MGQGALDLLHGVLQLRDLGLPLQDVGMTPVFVQADPAAIGRHHLEQTQSAGGGNPAIHAYSSGLTTISSFPRSSITFTATWRCSPASNGALLVPARWSQTLSS
ncbi:MAG: hypothetical protein A3H29_13185 [Acidobacteria bacterium RIFCSPLOWO2_02_FULL_67_21]|nr:MAG: hypothetical protein A3H29_13185 [Acidobacteria bacterium RIFCSPLOWO2_02_FULL_67_21]